MSYIRSYQDKVLRTDADIEKSNKRRKIKRIGFVATLLLLVTAFIVVARLPSLQITTITVEGVKSASPEDVELYVSDLIQGNWLYILPKRSILLFPDTFVKKSLHNQFPKFSSVEVKRKGARSISVTIREYEGVYLWCATEDDCSFMTSDGIVFMHAPFFSGSAYVKIFAGEAESYPFIPLSTSELSAVQLLLARLTAISIEPSEFYFRRGVTNRLEVVFNHNGSESKLFFDTSLSLEMSLDSLYATVRTDSFSRKYKSGLASLDYVDITLPNKVVYRFK